MGNIFSDIVEEVQVKPSHSKTILKWTVRIAIILIGAAFTYGQIKSSRLNRLDNIEDGINANADAIIDLGDKVNVGLNHLDSRIDKVYVDGYKAFADFQDYNKKQLGMIIDYSGSNKEMLKRMLDLISTEETKKVENQLEQAKANKDTLTIKVTPLKK